MKPKPPRQLPLREHSAPVAKFDPSAYLAWEASLLAGESEPIPVEMPEEPEERRRLGSIRH